LAYGLVLNAYVGKAWGKVLFVVVDILIGILIYKILNEERKSYVFLRPFSSLFFACFWLFNPYAVNVSTRGNAESIMGALVLSSLYYIHKSNIVVGGILYGLAVHFKIYPIIFSVALFFFLGNRYATQRQPDKARYYLVDLINRDSILFAFISALTFLSLLGLMYWLYGYEFIYETYLYHIWRQDIKHNFSVYFYSIYLSSSTIQHTTLYSIIVQSASLVPQLLILLAFSYNYFKQINFCLFIQTTAFVVFNKVCTVQYFIWYFSLFPLILPYTTIPVWKGILFPVVWVSSQLLWFHYAYKLEFLGNNTFYQIWLAGLLYFIVNVYILTQILSHHRFTHQRILEGDGKKEQ